MKVCSDCGVNDAHAAFRSNNKCMGCHKKRNREYLRALPTARRTAYTMAWAKRHPERWRVHQLCSRHNARAREFGVPGHIRPRDIEALPGECCYCGSTENIQLDHAVPLDRGGWNHWSNLTSVCRRCNGIKRQLTNYEFMSLILAYPSFRAYLIQKT